MKTKTKPVKTKAETKAKPIKKIEDPLTKIQNIPIYQDKILTAEGWNRRLDSLEQ